MTCLEYGAWLRSPEADFHRSVVSRAKAAKREGESLWRAVLRVDRWADAWEAQEMCRTAQESPYEKNGGAA